MGRSTLPRCEPVALCGHESEAGMPASCEDEGVERRRREGCPPAPWCRPERKLASLQVRPRRSRVGGLLDTHFPSRAYARRRTLEGTNVIPTWRDFPNLSDSTPTRFGRVALHPTAGVGLSEGEHGRDTRAWFGSYSLDSRSPRACRKPM